MKKLALFGLSLSLIASAQATDYEYVDDPVSGYNAKGVPTNMTNINDSLPSDILENIYSMLPESVPVNPAFIAPDILSNISIDDDLNGGYATVTVTFLNEGAGYRNSMGYFIYDTNNPPQTKEEIAKHTIIFPNASKPGAGNMKQGDTVDLNIQVWEGQSIGFFVVPNGWGWWGSGSTIESDGPWGQPFYSREQLNPEPLAEQRHNVVFVDPANELLVIGFDDQYISRGDRDFNDLLFAVEVTPFVAIDGVNPDGSVDSGYIPLSQTGGGDEITTSYYPSQNGMATVMFEDRWPVKGDYDFNDLVMQYQLKRSLIGENALSRLEGTYKVQAKGATYHNGFALRLPGIPSSNIESVSLLKNGMPVTHQVVEDGHMDTVLIFTPDMENDIITACEMFRTLENCREDINLEYTLDISFTNPVLPEVVGQPPYDPFIFAVPGWWHGSSFASAPGRGWELHLKKFAGTPLFNTSFYGLADDASNGSTNFIDANNMPWVINVGDNWQHPKERQSVSVAYPMFDDWVQSGGFNFVDWYLLENADTSKLY